MWKIILSFYFSWRDGWQFEKVIRKDYLISIICFLGFASEQNGKIT